MWDQMKPGPHHEQLSQAIIQAILSSSEVQERLEELREQGALSGEDILALAIRFPENGGLEAKVELMRKSKEDSAESEEEEDPAEPGGARVPSRRRERREFGSGSKREKTPNEIAFERYLQEQFDEADWMRKVGIRFLSEDEEKTSIREGDGSGREND